MADCKENYDDIKKLVKVVRNKGMGICLFVFKQLKSYSEKKEGRNKV